MRGVPLLLDGSTDRPTDRIFIACHDPLLFQERYAKMRPVASRYNIIQLGLCTFTKEKPGKGQGQEEQLVARPYNIYACADEGEDVCLSLSAISFLRGNNMNFNQWLSKGVTYVNAAGEAALRKRVEQEREKDRQNAEGGALNANNRLKLTRCVSRCGWLCLTGPWWL